MGIGCLSSPPALHLFVLGAIYSSPPDVFDLSWATDTNCVILSDRFFFLLSCAELVKNCSTWVHSLSTREALSTRGVIMDPRQSNVVFKIDSVSTRILYYVLGISVSFILVMLIIGLAGPSAHHRYSEYSFTCDGEHPYRYRNKTCDGHPMSEPGYVQHIYVPPLGQDSLTKLNYQFSLTAWPYSNSFDEPGHATVRDTINSRVSLLGTNTNPSNAEDGDWFYISKNRTAKQTLLCPKQRPDCYGFVMVLERRLEFKYYRVEVEFVDNTLVDNVRWVSTMETSGFNSIRLGFRITYLVISAALIGFWLYILSYQHHSHWTFEQQSVLILLIGLFSFNNPFFFLEFISESWVLIFMDNLFSITFTCVLLMYWFFTIDNFRLLTRKLRWVGMIKYCLIIVFGVLALVFSSWMDIRFNVQPILGTDNLGGIIALYYIDSCLLGAIIIWLIVLALLTLPTIYAKPYLEYRYMYLSVPACLICISLLIGIFAGSFGPYNRSTLSFLYFYALYNGYIYLLVFGFFPGEEWFNRGKELVISSEIIAYSLQDSL